MSQDRLQEVRTLVGTLLNKPTEGLEAKALYALIQEGIAAEHEMRRQHSGGGCTLTLNALLAIGGERLG